jgi:hypothetical protein
MYAIEGIQEITILKILEMKYNKNFHSFTYVSELNK